MTESEAVEILKGKFPKWAYEGIYRDEDKYEYEMAQLAIHALEKQIPVKPVRKLRSGMGNDYKDYYCSCGRFIGYEPKVHYYLKNGVPPFSYCCGCGRKIDWSDGNDA